MDIKKPSAIIGIDPGKTGAAAIISDCGIDYFDFENNIPNIAKELSIWKNDFLIELAVVEAVHSMPKQGVKSTFSLGHALGTIEGILSALSISYVKVPPKSWQKKLIRPSDGNNPKERSLAVARRLFPKAELTLKRHHGRSDSLLLAFYGKKLTQFR